jgi:non-lysosomal glucosylceramidase
VSSGETLAGAIAVRFTLKPGEKKVVPMVVSWDLPIIEFGTGRRWYRHYTDFYGTNGINALKIASEALKNAAAWSDAIDAWQAPYVSDEKRPDWYRGALFQRTLHFGGRRLVLGAAGGIRSEDAAHVFFFGML